jgi:replicative DNA helicase
MKRIKELWKASRYPSKKDIARAGKAVGKNAAKSVNGTKSFETAFFSANKMAARKAMLLAGVKEKEARRQLYKVVQDIAQRYMQLSAFGKDGMRDTLLDRHGMKIFEILGPAKGALFIRCYFSNINKLFFKICDESLRLKGFK